MPVNLVEYNKLKETADKAQRDSDRATGALQQLRDRLKKEFDCDTIEAAEKLLAKWEKEEAVACKELNRKISEFKEQYNDELGADSQDDE